MLHYSNVTARYGALEALRDVTLVFAKGERAAVFGHNGAGKTTLLKCGVGAIRDVDGQITHNSDVVLAGEVHRNVMLGLGLVPQGHNVFADLTVERNLRIAGLKHDLSFLEQVYELFPVLRERHGQLAGLMSGGEQQMLALGMAMMSRPKMLLLDEPTTGLAPVIVRKVLDSLLHINKTFGTALIIVEQNVALTLEVVDRAVVLKSGRVVFDGSAAELRATKNLWVWF